MANPEHDLEEQRRSFLREATRLAIESVERGWGGPFGAVIVRGGEIIGRGQNRVLLTGVPVYHAEVTAILDACARINPKALLGSGCQEGTLQLIARPPDSDDPAPQRARMLKGCDLYTNAAPCPMCMGAIHWARIDRVYFGTSLADASRIGFDDEAQTLDLQRPWQERRMVRCFPGFEREHALQAFQAWSERQERHPY